jgi:hypothetical protein
LGNDANKENSNGKIINEVNAGSVFIESVHERQRKVQVTGKRVFLIIKQA